MNGSRRIFNIIRPYLLLEIAILLCAFLTVGLYLLDPLALKIIIDKILIERNTSLLNTLILGLLALFAVRAGASIFIAYLYGIVGQRILFDLRFRLFRHIETLHLSFFARTKTGDILSRLHTDVDRLQAVVTSTVISAITDSFTFVGILGLLLILDWRLTLAAIAPLPFFVLLHARIGKNIKQVSLKTMRKSADILSFFQETIVGIRAVQSFVRERFEAMRLLQESKILIKLRVHLAVLIGYSTATAGFLMVAAPVVALWYGGNRVINGALSLGSLVAIYTYLTKLFGPAFRFARYNVDIQTARASVERIFEFLDIQPEIADAPHAVALNSTSGGIEFRDVSFSYDSNDRILDNLSFSVAPREVLAIVGKSGSGKTTILNLLCRFLAPSSGCILLDGHDISEITLNSLRRLIGLVSQETVLFNTSIGESIRYGRLNASSQEIVEAAKQAGIHELITSLPQKYDTVIGDRGLRLSGGEAQRLSIARTILKDPPILILDEAMSSLDMHSERFVSDSLRSLAKDRTCIMVAHRLSTMVDVDRIMVLEGGTIVETGTHNELLATGGEYRKLWDEMIRS